MMLEDDASLGSASIVKRLEISIGFEARTEANVMVLSRGFNVSSSGIGRADTLVIAVENGFVEQIVAISSILFIRRSIAFSRAVILCAN